MIAQILLSGLTSGSLYALIALGYSMVYGVLRMINFAHSEVFMSGPYTAYFFAAALDASGFFNQHPILSLMIIFVVSMATSTLIAVMSVISGMDVVIAQNDASRKQQACRNQNQQHDGCKHAGRNCQQDLYKSQQVHG